MPDLPAIVERLEKRVQRLEDVRHELSALERLVVVNQQIGDDTIKAVHGRMDGFERELREHFARIETMLQKAVLGG